MNRDDLCAAELHLVLVCLSGEISAESPGIEGAPASFDCNENNSGPSRLHSAYDPRQTDAHVGSLAAFAPKLITNIQTIVLPFITTSPREVIENATKELQ